MPFASRGPFVVSDGTFYYIGGGYDGGSVHTESQLPGRVGGDERRPGINSVERDDRVVAPVDERDDSVGGAEVDTDSHSAQS